MCALKTLSVANQQLTAIARSLTMNAKIIIMDEPSAALNETELKSVFEVIRDLTRQGVAILMSATVLANCAKSAIA